VRILTTGSSGQIGTNLALALLAAGHEVRGVDHRPNPWTGEIETDVIDLAELSAAPASYAPPWRPDCIVHLAAYAKVYELVLEPGKALETCGWRPPHSSWPARPAARSSSGRAERSTEISAAI
jgi:nucleoside-diphosphate-sugar epimerase